MDKKTYGSFKPLKNLSSTSKVVKKERYEDQRGNKLTIYSMAMKGNIKPSK